VELARVRRLPWPELVLLACGLLLALGVMVRSSAGECHQWKNRVNQITGGFLAAADAREFPNGGTQLRAEERDALLRATTRVLGDRPFGCL
jgi:hypothetical protein